MIVLKTLFKHSPKKIILPSLIFIILLGLVIGGYIFNRNYQNTLSAKNRFESALIKVNQDLTILKNQDQYQINQELQKTISNIEKTYQASIKAYEEINNLSKQKQKTDELEKIFARILKYLSEKNYSSAEADLKSLTTQINALNNQLTQNQTNQNIPVNNTPPSSGYQIQRVKIDSGEYTAAIVSADLNSTRVIVDTASDSTCPSNCPVLSLADYVSRNGAFAGINGAYFCPASYPSCVGKENAFDTLLMNKNKVYFNSDNNVYSNVPAVIFYENTARFVTRSSDWGRDTGVDAVLANQPLLVLDGNIVFTGDDEAKRSSVGTRNFIGTTDNKVYIGSIFSATAAEAAKVISALGIRNALNLDSGGSTALWSGGYKVGPGRNLPMAILFVSK